MASGGAAGQRPEPRLYERYVYHSEPFAGQGLQGPVIDSLVMRERDKDGNPATGPSGLEERLWYVQNARGDVVAMVKAIPGPSGNTDIGAADRQQYSLERIRYTPYGEPSCYASADVNLDGRVTNADITSFIAVYGAGVYDRRTDINGNGRLDPEGVETWPGADLPLLLSEKAAIDASAGANQFNGNDKLSRPDVDNRFGYAGYLWDKRLGLYQVRNRVYDPKFGRWLQRDPIGYAGGWNLYQYCGGEPNGRIDPTGLEDAACYCAAAAFSTSSAGASNPGGPPQSGRMGDAPAPQRGGPRDPFAQMGVNGDDLRAGSGPRDGRMMATAKLVRGFAGGFATGYTYGVGIGAGLGVVTAINPILGAGLGLALAAYGAWEAGTLIGWWDVLNGEQRAAAIGGGLGGIGGGITGVSLTGSIRFYDANNFVTGGGAARGLYDQGFGQSAAPTRQGTSSPFGIIASPESEAAIYDVGLAKALRDRPVPRTQVNHTPQSRQAESLLGDWSPVNNVGYEPAIRLAILEHENVTSAQFARTTTPASARELLASDIWILRRNTNTPNRCLKQLIELNMRTHPIDYMPLHRTSP